MEMIKSLAPLAGSVLGNMLVPGVGGMVGGGLVSSLLGSMTGSGSPGSGSPFDFRAGDQEEFKKILDTILGSADYTGLEAAANREIGQAGRALSGQMAFRGLYGSSLERDALNNLTADIQARLAQAINQDKLSRAQLAMGLYGNLLGAKGAAAAGDAEMWRGIGGIAGSVLGSDWFGKWLNSKLNASPTSTFSSGNSGTGFGLRYNPSIPNWESGWQSVWSVPTEIQQ